MLLDPHLGDLEEFAECDIYADWQYDKVVSASAIKK